MKKRAKGGGNGHIRPLGGRRGRLVEPSWGVTQSLCWILMVNVLDSILDLRDLPVRPASFSAARKAAFQL